MPRVGRVDVYTYDWKLNSDDIFFDVVRRAQTPVKPLDPDGIKRELLRERRSDVSVRWATVCGNRRIIIADFTSPTISLSDSAEPHRRFVTSVYINGDTNYAQLSDRSDSAGEDPAFIRSLQTLCFQASAPEPAQGH